MIPNFEYAAEFMLAGLFVAKSGADLVTGYSLRENTIYPILYNTVQISASAIMNSPEQWNNPVTATVIGASAFFQLLGYGIHTVQDYRNTSPTLDDKL